MAARGTAAPGLIDEASVGGGPRAPQPACVSLRRVRAAYGFMCTRSHVPRVTCRVHVPCFPLAPSRRCAPRCHVYGKSL